MWASAIAAVFATAAAVGMQIDRPAWISEVQQLAGEVQKLDAQVTNEILRGVQARIYQNEREQQGYKSRGEPVPQYLIEDRARLERDRRYLERKLEELR